MDRPQVTRSSKFFIEMYLSEMRTPRRLNRLFMRLGEAVQELAGKIRPKTEAAGMIGLPPSARGLTGRPADPALHAKEVAQEWEDIAEAYIQKRLRELGIPEHKIGAPDYEKGGVRRVFISEETKGGTNDRAGRLYVDSGVLNVELNAEVIGPEATKIWANARLRDRIEAVTAHEDLEARGVPHDEVVQRVPDTDLPIGENARKILRSMTEGAKRQAGR
jgi:hypothetical protein